MTILDGVQGKEAIVKGGKQRGMMQRIREFVAMKNKSKGGHANSCQQWFSHISSTYYQDLQAGRERTHPVSQCVTISNCFSKGYPYKKLQ